MTGGTTVLANAGSESPGASSLATSSRPRVRVCGVLINSLSMGEVVEVVEKCLAENGRLAIGVVNVAKVVNMQRNPMLRESVVSSDLVLADGDPLVWLSRLKRTPLPERVAGIDLMFELMSLANRRGLRVFLLGARKSTLDEVVKISRRDYPGMVLAGCHDGYFAESQEEEVAQSIRDSRPDLLFVAMNSPKKEIFMKKWDKVMMVPVCHGVGGSFDVMAGITRRAPRWMQQAGLEWFYRMVQEPRRMAGRYLVTNALFLGMALRDLLTPQRKRQCEQ